MFNLVRMIPKKILTKSYSNIRDLITKCIIIPYINWQGELISFSNICDTFFAYNTVVVFPRRIWICNRIFLCPNNGGTIY